MRLPKYCTVLIASLSILCSQTCFSQNKSAGIDLSLWKGIATQPYDTLQTTYLNLGIVSRINQLKGISLNGFSCVVNERVNGIQVAGLSNIAKGYVNGIQFAGLTNVNGNNSNGIITSGIANVIGENLHGIGASGLMNIIGGSSKGVLFSGLMNIIGSSSSGVSVAGLMNIESGGSAKGIKVAGMSNIIAGNQSGIIIGGLMNVTGSDMKGIQIASLGNITGGQTSGLQLSALGNIGVHVKGMQIAGIGNMARSLHGVQIGLMNLAEYTTEGVQIGLVNYSKSAAKAKIGLVNANPDTRYQIMIFGGNTNKGNVAVRFKNNLFYTILGMGDHYLGLDKKFSGSLFYRTGLGFQPARNLYLSGDLGYQHIENFQNKNEEGIPARMYALQARANVEYHFTNKFGIFTSGGYSVTKYYNKSGTFSKKPIVEVGIILF